MRASMGDWYSTAVPGAIVAVSFDAGGTLIDVREPVGDTYARHARALGFPVTSDAMAAGFAAAFASAPALAAPAAASADEVSAFERAWWRAVVARALAHALASNGSTDETEPAFERLFDDLFAHYATASAWLVHPDAEPALAELRARGVAIGILSNFDARLHPLMRDLGIARYVRAVVVSSEARAAKPARAAFDAAARALGGTPPDRLLHVGDSLHDDVRGAQAAGWNAAWIVRGAGDVADEAPPRGAARVGSLLEVARLVSDRA
ncbi:MAG TPA: HAD-IA family hydrolase [Candidatus Binatia bacterium]|nr:HAD-IA family hydrolase [Candidatus Binatia bacterium]